MPFKSLFKNITVASSDLKIFFWIAASVAEASAVNPNGTKTLLANGVSIFLLMVSRLSLMV